MELYNQCMEASGNFETTNMTNDTGLFVHPFFLPLISPCLEVSLPPGFRVPTALVTRVHPKAAEPCSPTGLLAACLSLPAPGDTEK